MIMTVLSICKQQIVTYLFNFKQLINKRMKKKNIYISLYILIPLIYTGISMIGIILTYQLFKQQENIDQISSLNFVYLIAVMAVITLFISFILLRLLFKPLMKFVNKTQKMPIIAKPQSEEQKI